MIRSFTRFQRALALVVASAVVILGGVAWTTHEQSVHLDETAGWADRTRASVAAIQAVALATLAAESAQRGVLLGSPTAAARYRAATDTARRKLDALTLTVDDDPQQRELLAGLRSAVEAQLARLDRAVALTPTQPDQARAVVLEAAGPQAGRDVQDRAAAMVAATSRRFDERVVLRRAVRHAAQTWTDATMALLVVAMALGALVMLRELKLRTAMTAALLESRTRLELGERRLRAIADNMPACIAYVDRTETYRFANTAIRALFGVEVDGIIGRTRAELMGPATHAALADRLARVLAGETVHFEQLGMGQLPHNVFMVTYVPDINAAGGVDGHYVMALDITARKKVELELANSERRLRTITDNLPATIVRMDANLVCNYANEHMRRLYGIDPASLVGTSHRAFRGEEEWAHIGPHVEAALRGELRRFEVRAHIRGDDTWVEQSIIPDVDADGRIVGYLSVTFDITERKLQEEALRKSEQFLKEVGDRMALATESGGIGIWELNIASGELIWDARMRQQFGDTSGGLVAPLALWNQRVHADDQADVQEAIRQASRGDRLFNHDYRVVLDGAVVRHLRGTARAVRDAEGRVTRLIGTNWDITELRELATSLAEDRSLLSVTLASIGDAVITTDARGGITWLNPVAERLTGWTSAQAIGRMLIDVFHVVDERTREPSPDPVESCLQQGRRVGLFANSLLLSRGGEEFGIEDSIAPIRREDGTVLGTVLVFHDVSAQRRLAGEMKWRATHDTLTGLVNRSEFEARLARLLQTAQEHGGEHALMYIDLDQFKIVNDACGHAAGDQLLQQMARLLTDSVRTRDMLARLGGDEFAILMERCTVGQAQRVAQKICDQMDDFRFMHEGRRFRIGTSIGLVPVDSRWQTTTAIQQAADTACYAAKEAGRNRVHTWFDTDTAMRERQFEMQWTTRIEHALDENGFVLYAQRITALKKPARGLHAEVLLRMRQADGALVAPGAFLPAAERFHLASRIDRWVLRSVVEWMTALVDPARIELLSVNLSGQSVGDRSFHRWALELLGKAGPRLCGALCLEITETAAVTNIADAAQFIDQLRACGVKVALDDFGAGAASFGYLKTLQVDTLKIDGQFVRDLVDDPLDAAAVRCFADVAKVMGLTTVAEFVDKPAVLARLQAMDIDYAQGYLLHEPAPIDELIELAVTPRDNT